MLLPAPVEPMTATVWPGSARKVRSLEHRRVGARVAELDAVEGERAALGQVDDGLARRGTTDVSVWSTSITRSAQTADRGIIIIMKVPIITAITICIR